MVGRVGEDTAWVWHWGNQLPVSLIKGKENHLRARGTSKSPFSTSNPPSLPRSIDHSTSSSLSLPSLFLPLNPVLNFFPLLSKAGFPQTWSGTCTPNSSPMTSGTGFACSPPFSQGWTWWWGYGKAVKPGGAAWAAPPGAFPVCHSRTSSFNHDQFRPIRCKKAYVKKKA